MEIAGTAPTHEEIEKLTSRIFASAGIASSPSMNFNDFKKAFSEHNDLMQRVSLDLKGIAYPISPTECICSTKWSFIRVRLNVVSSSTKWPSIFYFHSLTPVPWKDASV